MGVECSARGGDEKCLNNLVRESKGNRQLGRPRHRWEDNVNMNLRDMGLEVVDWII
jgi:hypothetical protein